MNTAKAADSLGAGDERDSLVEACAARTDVTHRGVLIPDRHLAMICLSWWICHELSQHDGNTQGESLAMSWKILGFSCAFAVHSRRSIVPGQPGTGRTRRISNDCGSSWNPIH